MPPLDAAEVIAKLKNARNPALNLDALYGDGPFAPPPAAGTVAVPYQEQDKAKLRLGVLTSVNFGVRIPPVDDLARDLPRVNKVPQIGDGRNDENLIIAQLHWPSYASTTQQSTGSVPMSRNGSVSLRCSCVPAI